MGKTIAVGAAVAGAFAAIVVLYSHEPVPAPAFVAREAPSTTPQPVALPEPPPAPQAASSPVPAPRPRGAAPSARLVAELKAAKDWRAFALAALARPEEGGYFYATYVANLCGRDIVRMPEVASNSIKATVAETGTISPTRIAMIEKFMGQCASFAPDEASVLHRATMQAAATDRRDPIVNAVRDLSAALKKRDPGLTKDALRGLLALDDPLPLYKDALMERVMSKSTEAKVQGDLWFDGVLYATHDAHNGSTLSLALRLAACGDSAALCEIDDHMMGRCLGGGDPCTENREEFLRGLYIVEGGMTEEHFAQGVALSTRIRQAVANREVEAWVR